MRPLARLAYEASRRMLHGNIGAVIRALTWQGTHLKLKGKLMLETTLKRIVLHQTLDLFGR